MHSWLLALIGLSCPLLPAAWACQGALDYLDQDILYACKLVQQQVSAASAVFYPASRNYTDDMSHYFASSSQNATCAVEPGDTKDLAIVLKIVGDNRIPFAVKSGGHASNPGFSSTQGIQIALTLLRDLDYDAFAQTITIGAGLRWDDVYAALDPLGVVCLGGRTPGIGVGGFTLGGGYSWHANQYGLAIDTVAGFELVLPNGNITSVTNTSNPDLFFGLKGGGNNFGIVTKVIMRVFPQGPIWGGVLFASADQYDRVINATAVFSATVADPKAAIIPSFFYTSGMLAASVILFYDGPEPPEGLFDDFLDIPTIASDVTTRSFFAFFQTLTANSNRGMLDTPPVLEYTWPLIRAFANETIFWSDALKNNSAGTIIYSVEPFLPSILSHMPVSSAAYPPRRDRVYLPSSITFGWTNPAQDTLFKESLQQTRRTLVSLAALDGQPVTPMDGAYKYPNYAALGTPLEQLYGEHLPRLRDIKQRYDPEDVMGLTGGWKL